EVADGEADEPLEDLALSSATARDDRTKSAAAVVTVTVLSIASLLYGLVGKAQGLVQVACRDRVRIGCTRPNKGGTDVESIHGKEGQSEKGPEEGARAALQIQVACQDRADAPCASLPARGEALPGRPEELLSLELIDPAIVGGLVAAGIFVGI